MRLGSGLALGLPRAVGARPDDGLLNISLVDALGRLQIVRRFPSILSGSYVKDERVDYFTGKRLEIDAKPTAELQADGDIIGERIWGRPMSLVKKWGAAICTGFYFVRSTPSTIAIMSKSVNTIIHKRRTQPSWQASDQWAINHAINDQVVQWESGACSLATQPCRSPLAAHRAALVPISQARR